MAKGNVKKLQDYISGNVSINGYTGTLKAEEMGRGTDKVPTFALELTKENVWSTLASILRPTGTDEAKQQLAISGFIHDALNAKASLAWRTTVENTPKDTHKASDEPGYIELMKSFKAQLETLLNGERKEREKDASFYRRQAAKFMQEAKAEKDPAKRALALANAKDSMAIAKRKEEEELNELLSLEIELGETPTGVQPSGPDANATSEAGEATLSAEEIAEANMMNIPKA